MEVFEKMIAAQGGDLSVPLPVATERHIVTAERSGYLKRLDARGVGIAAWRLGAGRARQEDPVSPIAGVVCHAKEGAKLSEGDPILELHLDDVDRLPRALEALQGAIQIGDHPVEPSALILDRVV